MVLFRGDINLQVVPERDGAREVTALSGPVAAAFSTGALWTEHTHSRVTGHMRNTNVHTHTTASPRLK